MNWLRLRKAPWIDTRAAFVAATPHGGNLLDIGTSDGATLNHFAELRPDLQLHATDLFGKPENYPKGSRFHRGDIQKDQLPWAAGSMDAITAMHLVEHLTDLDPFYAECARLLKPGGRLYIETPHPKSLTMSSAPAEVGSVATVNFYDDQTHTRVVPVGSIGQSMTRAGLKPVRSGQSRNLAIAAAYPFLLFTRSSRSKYVSYIHWMGWSAYVIGQKAA
jgi:SAM-dependent methyltransferase